eukprot:7291007-Lingulodinium_polyedra.AAC.1
MAPWGPPGPALVMLRPRPWTCRLLLPARAARAGPTQARAAPMERRRSPARPRLSTSGPSSRAGLPRS